MQRPYSREISTNLFSGNYSTLFLIKKKRLTDTQSVTVVTLSNWQKQPPEVFYKRSCSQKFCNIYRKTPVFEAIFHKYVDLQDLNFIRKRLQHRCFLLAKYFVKYLFWRTSAYSCFWTGFAKLLFKTFIMDNCFQNHPDLVILQTYQLHFQIRALNTIPCIFRPKDLIPTLCTVRRFCMFIIND